jgi:hypothetical protein
LLSKFSQYLRYLRGTRSKTEVERATKVKRASIHRAETGERLLRVSTLKTLVFYYGGDLRTAINLMSQAREERDQRRATNG